MADNSLITKEHLRLQSERLVDKLSDADTVTGAAIASHNTNTEAHADIRQAIEDAIYTHPSHTARTSGLYKITVDDKGHVTAVTAVTKADITALGIPGEDTDTVYTHPSHTARTSGLYKIIVDDKGHVTGVTAVTKADITALGIPAQDTTYTHPTYTQRATALWKVGVDASGHVNAVSAVQQSDLKLLNMATLDDVAAASGGGVPVANAASSDGIAYTATVDGIDALTAGQMVVFLSTKTSASTAPTLNINGLGAKTIKRRQSNLSSTTAAGASNNWLYANKPQLLMYDGSYWIVVNQDKPAASDLYGSIAVDKIAASSDNEGQFLRVVSGVPTWSTIANAEEASF